ncbi:MAG TPA: hypothetical protein DCM40_27360 [Maribacter sp.]|nr:hypothetical protein [Maribacter sp.]
MTVMPNIDDTMRINDDLIEKWEPKIYKMLQNAYIEGWEKEDLVQELRLTIIRAAKKYDSNRNASFHTYLHTAMVNTLRTLHTKSTKKVDTVSMDRNNSSSNLDGDEFTLKDKLPSTDNSIDELRLDHFLNSLGLENNEKEFLTMKYKNYTMEHIQDNLTDTSIYKVKKSLRNKYKEGE